MENIYRYTGIVTVWGAIILATAVTLLWLAARVLDARKKMIRDRHWLWCWYEWTFRRRAMRKRLLVKHRSVWNPFYFRVFGCLPQPYQSRYLNLYGELLMRAGWLAKHEDWDWRDQGITLEMRVPEWLR